MLKVLGFVLCAMVSIQALGQSAPQVIRGRQPLPPRRPPFTPPPPPVSAPQEAPPRAEISEVRVSGSGCDETTAAVSFTEDLQDLSILFDNYVLEAGASNVNLRTLRAELNCNVDLQVRIPRGWSFAFQAVDYRGFADIPRGVTGYQRLVFSHPNTPMVSMREARFAGPVSSNYDFSGQQKRLNWSPCGQESISLGLLSILGVQYTGRGHYPDAMIALDSQDLSIKQSLQVIWRRCY